MNFSFLESENKTLLTNFYHIDSLKINGKWEIEKLSEQIIHHIPLKNNTVLIELFVQKVDDLNYYKKKLKNGIILEKYILVKYANYNYTKLKCEVLTMREDEFYCIEFENRIEFISIKENTIFSIFINSSKMNKLEKVNFLIDFFNHIEI